LRVLATAPLDPQPLKLAQQQPPRSTPLALEAATEAAWVLAHVTSKDEAIVAPLVERDGGAIPVAVRCILSGHLPLVTPALRVLGNILGLTEAYADRVLAHVRRGRGCGDGCAL